VKRKEVKHPQLPKLIEGKVHVKKGPQGRQGIRKKKKTERRVGKAWVASEIQPGARIKQPWSKCMRVRGGPKIERTGIFEVGF